MSLLLTLWSFTSLADPTDIIVPTMNESIPLVMAKDCDPTAHPLHELHELVQQRLAATVAEATNDTSDVIDLEHVYHPPLISMPTPQEAPRVDPQ